MSVGNTIDALREIIATWEGELPKWVVDAPDNAVIDCGDFDELSAGFTLGAAYGYLNGRSMLPLKRFVPPSLLTSVSSGLVDVTGAPLRVVRAVDISKYTDERRFPTTLLFVRAALGFKVVIKQNRTSVSTSIAEAHTLGEHAEDLGFTDFSIAAIVRLYSRGLV